MNFHKYLMIKKFVLHITYKQFFGKIEIEIFFALPFSLVQLNFLKCKSREREERLQNAINMHQRNLCPRVLHE